MQPLAGSVQCDGLHAHIGQRMHFEAGVVGHSGRCQRFGVAIPGLILTAGVEGQPPGADTQLTGGHLKSVADGFAVLAPVEQLVGPSKLRRRLVAESISAVTVVEVVQVFRSVLQLCGMGLANAAEFVAGKRLFFVFTSKREPHQRGRAGQSFQHTSSPHVVSYFMPRMSRDGSRQFGRR